MNNNNNNNNKKETFRDYIKNKINKNHLPLDVDETFKIVTNIKWLY